MLEKSEKNRQNYKTKMSFGLIGIYFKLRHFSFACYLTDFVSVILKILVILIGSCCEQFAECS